MVTPTFWLLNFSSQAADSAMPAMQVSAITHSTRAPQAWQFLADKRGGGFRHVHGLRFQRLADPHATTIDYRADTDLR
jgi:hypothetical protein